jgi:hypothetical protein
VRSTRELVLVIFSITVGAVLVLTVGGLLTIELVHPEVDTAPGLEAAWNVASLMLGGIVGYLFAVRRKNGNGHG